MAKSIIYPLNQPTQAMNENTEFIRSELPGTYLGLPLGARFKDKQVWKNLVELFRKKLAMWKKKFLSKGARLVLIKATLAAMPIHLMTLLPMPKSIESTLTTIMRNFLWDSSPENSRLHMVSWKKVCRPIQSGGLGIRQLVDTNKAHLAKWVWELFRPDDALWKRVVRQKYNVKTTFWATKMRHAPIGCSLWRDIWKMAEWVEVNTSIKPAKGDAIRFWEDKWIGAQRLSESFPTIYNLSSNREGTVEQHKLNSEGQLGWNLFLRRRLQDHEMEEVQRLLAALPTCTQSNMPDLIRWNDCQKPLTVKEAASRFQSQHNLVNMTMPTKKIWLKNTPSRVNFFMWALYQNKIQTQDTLKLKGIPIINRCIMCKEREESVQHLFWECKLARQVLQQLTRSFQCMVDAWHGPQDFIRNRERGVVSSLGELMWKGLSHAFCWGIWGERNSRTFEDKEHSPVVIIQKILRMIWTWYGFKPQFQGLSGSMFCQNWAGIVCM